MATRELCWGMLGHVAQERESALASRARATVMVPCEESSPLVRRLARDPLLVGRATRRVTRQLLRCAINGCCEKGVLCGEGGRGKEVSPTPHSFLFPSHTPVIHPLTPAAAARGRPSHRRRGGVQLPPGESRAPSSTRPCSPPPSASRSGGGASVGAGGAPS